MTNMEEKSIQSERYDDEILLVVQPLFCFIVKFTVRVWLFFETNNVKQYQINQPETMGTLFSIVYTVSPHPLSGILLRCRLS